MRRRLAEKPLPGLGLHYEEKERHQSGHGKNRSRAAEPRSIHGIWQALCDRELLRVGFDQNQAGSVATDFNFSRAIVSPVLIQSKVIVFSGRLLRFRR
jgi:hypothetical protein